MLCCYGNLAMLVAELSDHVGSDSPVVTVVHELVGSEAGWLGSG